MLAALASCVLHQNLDLVSNLPDGAQDDIWVKFNTLVVADNAIGKGSVIFNVLSVESSCP